MLKTPLCDRFGIEVPIILAPMGTCTSADGDIEQRTNAVRHEDLQNGKLRTPRRR